MHDFVIAIVVAGISLRVWEGNEWNLFYLFLPSGSRRLLEGVESALNALCWEPEKSGQAGERAASGTGLCAVTMGQLWVMEDHQGKQQDAARNTARSTPALVCRE